MYKKTKSAFETWNAIHALVERSYVDGKPRYLSQSAAVAETSAFRIITEKERAAMSSREWQNMLRRQNIVEILERPTVSAEFDLEGLAIVTNLTKPIVVHG